MTPHERSRELQLQQSNPGDRNNAICKEAVPKGTD